MSETTNETTASRADGGEGRDASVNSSSAPDEEYIEVKTWKAKWVDPVVDVLLYMVSGLLLLAAGLYVMTAFFGFSLYSFSSGSMEPTINTGAVSLAREVEDPSTIEVGDILTVNHPEQNIPLTHRVIKVNDEESIQQAIDDSVVYGIVQGERSFLNKLTNGLWGENTEREEIVNVSEEDIEAGNLVVINMQGDANDSEDPRVYAVGPDSADRYVIHVAAAGEFLEWVRGNLWFVLGGAGLVLLYVIFPFEDTKRVRKSDQK